VSRVELRKLVALIPIFGVAMAALVLRVPAAHAATITVAAGAVDVDGADGLCSLIEAIENANDDAATHADCAAGNGADTIELAGGATYELTANLGGGFGLPAISDDLLIRGNGATIRRPLGIGNFGLMNNAPGNELTLRNMTLQDGNNQITGGGAVYNSGHLTANNVTFLSNSALITLNGGAIYVNPSASGTSLSIINSSFDDNTAGGDGGAIYGSGSNWQIRIRNTTFDNNSAADDGGAIYLSQEPGIGYIGYSTFTNNDTAVGDGGAIYFFSTGGETFPLDHVTISSNEAGGGGGGIYVSGNADVEVQFSELSGNTAPNGGAMVAFGGAYTVTQSAITGNTATNLAGGIHSIGGAHGLIRFSEISENTATSHGGGLYADSSITQTSVRANHTTISGNVSGDRGGGIYNITGVFTLTFTTVVTNTADDSGGGIYNTGRSGSDGELFMQNSIVLGNALTTGIGNTNCYNGANAAWTSLDYNRFPNSALGGCVGLFGGANDADIIGSPSTYIDMTLADNGGATRTHAIVPLLNDPDSMFNKIPDMTNRCRAGLTLDQRGYVRANGSGAGGANCDIGAYEHNAQCAVPSTPDVAISLSGDDVVLSWTEPQENYSTEIWRDSDPYFDPAAPGGKTPFNILGETATFHDDAAAPDASHYYIARGVAGCGDVSTGVDRVGMFNFPLVSGS
jgi:predicted outer membrane repeat protein